MEFIYVKYCLYELTGKNTTTNYKYWHNTFFKMYILSQL